MLDRALLEFALKVPPFLLRRESTDRWLARKVAERIVPAEIAWQSLKEEPLRVAEFETARDIALDLIADWIGSDPSRLASKHIVVEELLDRLHRRHPVTGRRAPGVLGALRLLDFEPLIHRANMDLRSLNGR